MPDDARILRDREKALEEAFFRKQDEELRKRLRDKETLAARRAALQRVAAVNDAATIDHLLELGITAETWAAISLVPLVEVAWANGRVDEKEQRAVLAAAEANGITPGSPSHQILSGWLDQRPDGRVMEAWGAYIVALCAQLSPEEKHALRDELMGRARHVAEATGGFLGLGRRVSPEEEVVLDELAKAFPD